MWYFYGTGSGKSTLAMSILRFVDPASGRILIDGIDISTIGIHDLRSRLVSRSWVCHLNATNNPL